MLGLVKEGGEGVGAVQGLLAHHPSLPDKYLAFFSKRDTDKLETCRLNKLCLNHGRNKGEDCCHVKSI